MTTPTLGSENELADRSETLAEHRAGSEPSREPAPLPLEPEDRPSGGDFGIIYKIFSFILRPWTSRVRPLTADVDELRRLQDEGQLLLVGHVVSFINFMIVNEYLKRNGLRTVRYTHGFSPFWVLPFTEALAIYREQLFVNFEQRRNIELERALQAVDRGENAFIFLKRGGRFAWSKKVYYYHGTFGRIWRNLTKQTRNTYLVPTSVFLTRRRKRGTVRNFWEIFFGTYDIPGRIRRLWQLLINCKKGGTIFSRHVDLNAELEKNAQVSEAQIDKRLRRILLLHLNNEDAAYRGPTKRSVERKVRKILRERRLNNELEAVAERTGRSLESVRKEAEKNLRHIASDTSERTINLLRIFFGFVWTKTIEGIDVHQEDLQRVREMTKNGPVLFLPCHRSHVDYLVFAYLFEKEGLNYPRFAAGENLSKWPLGPILRRAGAFFIRRSFKGEVIFPLVFDAYLRHILRERHVLVFFMEGGRSRTGKLLQPKTGMMNMVIDAWRQGIVDDLPLVPVTIDYGKVFEGQSFIRENSGAEKKQESLGSVIRSRKVLKRKHGWIRLRFDEPIYLNEYAEEQGLSKDDLGFKTRIPFVNDLSYKVLNRVNDSVTLTAGNIIAGLLLGNPRRGMRLSDLKALFGVSVRYLKNRGVDLAFPEPRLDMALDNALQTFEQWETLVQVEVGGETVVNIPREKRAEMEYYKNNGLHFILDLTLFCTAFECLEPDERTPENLLAFARRVYGTLQHEFLIRDDYPTADNMEHAQKALEVLGGVKQVDGLIVPGDQRFGNDLVHINGHLLLNFFESYFIAAEVLSEQDPEIAVDRKQFLKICTGKGRLLYAVGTVRLDESINHVTFGNALTYYQQQGFIKFQTPKGSKSTQILLVKGKEAQLTEIKKRLFDWTNLLE
ncbi:1-acyl-sn-glycerol-3-phosphate acyltransferase [Sulfidibacter corallicola]|uniref:Glycerol-3-phosphate acyltransferase n=1 Tax=Sulfidibacter corallicola TaxID=2818388 RepID=A0A8A4TXZ2_SULCO|nr:1-acyl-sn-glycerol-3-phosphate acyltransferase [Sulfidibacter corallicola]QTD54101.1 1-acyl-sn-glycerol-3-phosphate acyltransferase [Sulfidibacter corallicola]